MTNLLQTFLSCSRSVQVKFLLGTVLVSVTVLCIFFADFISPFDPLEMNRETMVLPPSKEHIFGTDNLGRDILSRAIHGARNSSLTAILAILIASIMGVSLGAVSGYYGKMLDRALATIMDGLYAYPSILFAILIASVLGPGVKETALAISVGFIPMFYRVIRSLTLSLKERVYVEASRMLGASNVHTIRYHIAPFYLPSLTALFSLGMSRAMLTVAGLGFLGLGLPPPMPDWGTDLSAGRILLSIGAWWPSTFYGLMIFLAILGFTLLSESLNIMLTK